MTIIIYDDIYLEHDTGSHVENALRLSKTVEYLQQEGAWENVVEPRAATVDEIRLVHETQLIDRVKAVCEEGGGHLDPDTVVSPRSYEAALYAAGGVLTAIEQIMEGRDSSALCLVRPPGHHATPSRAMGFCLFNNAAIGVRYLQKKHGLARVAIVDWDVHHGNGTQEVFYHDSGVLYFSTHRWPFYPGTGLDGEKGESDGAGLTVNRPMDYGTTREEFLEVFQGEIEGKVAEFKPEFIVISAGFDALAADMIGHFCLEPGDFGTMTQMVCRVAKEVCNGRVVSTLEGGYNLDLLPLCIHSHLKALKA